MSSAVHVAASGTADGCAPGSGGTIDVCSCSGVTGRAVNVAIRAIGSTAGDRSPVGHVGGAAAPRAAA